jgi:hypothetical protein
MKPILTLITVLLLAPLAASAHDSTQPITTVRDRLWVFAPPADGPRLYYESAGYRGGSRMTPMEGAFWLDVPNLLFITQDWNRPPSMWAGQCGALPSAWAGGAVVLCHALPAELC